MGREAPVAPPGLLGLGAMGPRAARAPRAPALVIRTTPSKGIPPASPQPVRLGAAIWCRAEEKHEQQTGFVQQRCLGNTQRERGKKGHSFSSGKDQLHH